MADDKSKLILCPYCGSTQSEPEDRCVACGGFFDNLSLKVTQQHMGPWFVRDRHHPFRPGCSYEVLKKQIERGKVRPTTIVRGPTTRQFWSIARNVPGVAHLLGYCHACGSHVETTAERCPQCQTRFLEPQVRDKLGLAPAGAEMPTHGELTGTGAEQATGLRFPAEQSGGAGDNGGTGHAAAAGAGAAGAASASSESAGSPILAGLRSGGAATGQGGGATATRDPQAVTEATNQAKRAREAMAWMTSDAEGEPDTLATAGEPTATLQQRSTNWWTWLLIAVNVGIFAVVIAAAVVMITSETDSDGPAQAGVGGGDVVQPGEDPIQSNQGNQANPFEDDGNDGNGAGGNGNDGGGNAGNGDSGGDDGGNGEASMNGEAGGGGEITDDDNGGIFNDGGPNGENGMAANRWAQRFEEALELEQRDQLAEALKLLKRIRAEAPEDQRPAELDEAIQRVDEELDRRAAEIFG